MAISSCYQIFYSTRLFYGHLFSEFGLFGLRKIRRFFFRIQDWENPDFFCPDPEIWEFRYTLRKKYGFFDVFAIKINHKLDKNISCKPKFFFWPPSAAFYWWKIPKMWGFYIKILHWSKSELFFSDIYFPKKMFGFENQSGKKKSGSENA